MSFCTCLPNFTQIGPPTAGKRRHVDFLKMADLRHLEFMDPIVGYLKSPCRTSCRSSIETVGVKCLIFGDGRTDEQMDRPNALSRSRYRERRWRFNNEVGTLAVDWWAITFGSTRRVLGGAPVRPVPSSLYQNPTHQRPCTNYRIAV